MNSLQNGHELNNSQYTLDFQDSSLNEINAYDERFNNDKLSQNPNQDLLSPAISPKKYSTKEMLASHDASIASHKQKLEEHKKWLEDQRMQTPNMINTVVGEAWSNDENDTVSFESEESYPQDISNVFNLKISNHNLEKDSIENQLLRKGAELQEKREKLRLNKLEQEKDILTFSPKISRGPQNYFKPSPRIEDRLQILERSREERLETERIKSMEQYTFKPELTKTSQDLIPHRPDILDISQKWKEVKNQKLEQARLQKEQDDLKELRDAPQLSERTLKLLRSINYRVPQQSIADYHAAQELKRIEKVNHLQEKHYQDVMKQKPEISSLSRKLVQKLDRDGTVSDRLYQESFKRNQERSRIIEEKEKYVPLDEMKKFTFQPDTPLSPRNSDIYQQLVKKGQEIAEKRQQRLELLEAREKQLHSKSKINPVSAEIASRLPTTSKERLYATKKKTVEDFNDELTFKPKINEKSKEMIRETEYNQSIHQLSPRTTSRGEMLHSLDQRKREKIQSLQEYYEQLEVVECTFKPDLKKSKKYAKSIYTFAADDESEYNLDTQASQQDDDSIQSEHSQFYGLPFHERNDTWNKKREKKRLEAQRVAKESELKECTFSPKIVTSAPDKSPNSRLTSPRGIKSPNSRLTSPRGIKSPRGSRSSVQSPPVLQQDGNPLGFESFVERQRSARQRKSEVDASLSPQMGPWQNRITTPQPFKLGRERIKPSGVKALQKVLSPPTFKKHVQKTQGSNANEFFLDEEENVPKPSPIRTEGIPPQGLFSTKSSVHILDSIGRDITGRNSPKPKILDDTTESMKKRLNENDKDSKHSLSRQSIDRQSFDDNEAIQSDEDYRIYVSALNQSKQDSRQKIDQEKEYKSNHLSTLANETYEDRNLYTNQFKDYERDDKYNENDINEEDYNEKYDDYNENDIYGDEYDYKYDGYNVDSHEAYNEDEDY